MLYLAAPIRASVGARVVATDDLWAMCSRIGLKVDRWSFPPPVYAVYAHRHVGFSPDLDRPWRRLALAGALAGVILGMCAYVLRWPLPSGDADLPPEARRVLALAGWLIFGDLPTLRPELRDPGLLADVGELPLLATRRWVRLAAEQMAQQALWQPALSPASHSGCPATGAEPGSVGPESGG